MNENGKVIKENVFLNKSFDFAVLVVKTSKEIVESKKEFILSKQFIRSGTAVGALIREAQNAESKADFIHKLAIAQKECDETIYWLDVLLASDFINQKQHNELASLAHELLKLLRSSILTTKQKHITKS